MSIRLGNLSENEIENRLGINLPKDLKEFMKDNRQQSAANVAQGKWHCFDIPFEIVCGGRDVAQKIYDCLKDRSSEVKTPLQFSVQS